MAATKQISAKYGWVVGWLLFHGVLGVVGSVILLATAPGYAFPYLVVGFASVAAGWGLRREESWAWRLAIAIESVSVVGCIAVAILASEGVALVQGAISAAAVISLVRIGSTPPRRTPAG
jgi:hypothetical protein